MEKVEVRHTKDGKGSGLFAMEDIEKDDYVIEYVGKIEYKRRENNYMMKINGMILWINGDRNGGTGLEWSSSLITIGIGYADRLEQFACAGQKIVMDVLTRKKDVENNLGMSEYDRMVYSGVKKIQFRS